MITYYRCGDGWGWRYTRAGTVVKELGPYPSRYDAMVGAFGWLERKGYDTRMALLADGRGTE